MFYIDNEANTTDKFDMCKFIELDKNGVFDSLNSYMLYAIPQLPTVGTYKIRQEVGAPDYLAKSIYDDEQYWWILMWYNHLLHPDQLVSGLEIRYPSLTAIQQLYTQTSLYEKVNK